MCTALPCRGTSRAPSSHEDCRPHAWSSGNEFTRTIPVRGAAHGHDRRVHGSEKGPERVSETHHLPHACPALLLFGHGGARDVSRDGAMGLSVQALPAMRVHGPCDSARNPRRCPGGDVASDPGDILPAKRSGILGAAALTLAAVRGNLQSARAADRGCGGPSIPSESAIAALRSGGSASRGIPGASSR